MPASCTKAGPVVYAISGRQDSPAPGLTTRMHIAAQEAARQGSTIGVVSVDGAPKLIGTWSADTRNMNSSAAQLYDVNFVAALAHRIQAVRATSPHADVVDALEIAGRAIRAARAACHALRGGTIFLEDSGLQDVGPLNFTRPGQLEALPPAVVSFLSEEHEIPDLAGMMVVLVGFGDTATPQRPLAIGQQAHLRAIWSAVIKAGGGQVETDPFPRENPAPRGVPPVNLIAVPPLPVWPGVHKKSFLLPDTGPFGFRPNTATFRHPSGAQNALSNIARYLLDNPTVKIELTGTTARWGSDESDVTLSTQRANAVKSALVSLGDSPEQILARGTGWRSPCYERDGGPKGPLLEPQARHNRSVIVTVLPNRVTC
jgi:outer membrane protein OmpA-like peptidoglycan-associated protein